MSTYIQVNIYNQTLDVLQMRGLDLKMILKTIGCPDTWITEVPIPDPVKTQPALPLTIPKVQTETSDDRGHSTKTNQETNSEESGNKLIKPFKSISAEIGFIKPLNLADALGTSQSSKERKTDEARGLFDDWDPTAYLETPGTSSGTSADQNISTGMFKVPKEEIPEEKNETCQTLESSSFDINDPVFSTEQERAIMNELLRQQNISIEEETPSSSIREKRKPFGEESEGHNNYVISCNYPCFRGVVSNTIGVLNMGNCDFSITH
uniref:Rad21_Rec8 domain-containing protein n=1 Tax=Caenorhabditis tropicalis TaxID=1561998 RepID=A0A1I7V4U4_9PELO